MEKSKLKFSYPLSLTCVALSFVLGNPMAQLTKNLFDKLQLLGESGIMDDDNDNEKTNENEKESDEEVLAAYHSSEEDNDYNANYFDPGDDYGGGDGGDGEEASNDYW